MQGLFSVKAELAGPVAFAGEVVVDGDGLGAGGFVVFEEEVVDGEG